MKLVSRKMYRNQLKKRMQIRSTILAVGIYAKKKKVHLLTINEHITAYEQLNSWYDLPGPQSQWPSFWASICEEIQVMIGQTLCVVFPVPP